MRKESQGVPGTNDVGAMEPERLHQKRVVDRIVNWVTVVSLGLLLVVYPEAKQMEITIGGLGLTLITTIIGVILACFIYVSFVRRFPFLKETSLMLRISILFMVVLGSSGLAMGTTSYINRTFAEKETFYKEVRIKKKASSSRNRYRNSSEIRLLYVAIDGKTERIEVKEDFWFTVSEGSTILLELRRGFFGYSYVVGHEKTNEIKGQSDSSC
jgi:hypothetical protein